MCQPNYHDPHSHIYNNDLAVWVSNDVTGCLVAKTVYVNEGMFSHNIFSHRFFPESRTHSTSTQADDLQTAGRGAWRPAGQSTTVQPITAEDRLRDHWRSSQTGGQGRDQERNVSALTRTEVSLARCLFFLSFSCLFFKSVMSRRVSRAETTCKKWLQSKIKC